MSLRTGPWVVGSLILTLAISAGLPVAAAVATELRQPEAAGDAEAAKAVVERARQAYAQLKWYRDEAEMGFVQETEGAGADHEMTMSMKLRYAAPDQLVIETEHGSVWMDQQTVWLVNPQTDEYIKLERPKKIDLQDLQMTHMLQGPTYHPLSGYLTDAKSRPRILKGVKEVLSVRAEAQEGRPGKVVQALVEMEEGFPGAEESPAMLWFDDATGLLGKVTVDMTKAYRQAMEQALELNEDMEVPEIKQVLWTTTLKNIRIDEEIAAAELAFVPEEKMKEVEEFTSQWRMADGDIEELVGQPAPEFEGELLDGTKFSLAEARGKVVLLDFWATWCGPCVQAMPHIQELADTFKDKPVLVLGMNRDAKNAGEKVAKFLEKKSITFAQFMDPAGDAATKYHVQGIPSTVLIDQQGVVRDVRVGFSRGAEEELADNINRLLEGKPVESTPVRAVAAPAREAKEPAAGQIEDVNPAGLEPLEAVSLRAGYIDEYRTQRVEIDGKKWIGLPSQNSLVLVSEDGAESRTIRVKGTRGASITAFAPIRIDGEELWVLGVSRWDSRGNQSPPSFIGVDREGEELWRYQPELPEGRQGEAQIAGAVSGPDGPRIVVWLNTHILRKQGANSYMHVSPEAYLLTLDGTGNVQSRRRVGNRIGQVFLSGGGEGDQEPVAMVVSDQKVRRYQLR